MATKEYMSVKGVEIFQTGDHTDSHGETMSWDMSDLREMVANFEGGPVRLGHTSDLFLNQVADELDVPKGALVGDEQGSGQMRLGHLDKLRIKGDTLLVDLIDVPDPLGEMIKSGAYNSVSSEIDVGEDGSPKMVGLALLGFESPALESLKSLQESTLIFSLPKMFSSGRWITYTQPKVTKPKEVNMPKPKEKHLAAIDAALTEGLRVELARRRLRSKKPDTDEFEEEITRIASDQAISFNKALGVAAKLYPLAMRQYVRRVQSHVNEVAEQQGMFNEAEQFAFAAKSVASVSQQENITIPEALKLVDPKTRAIFQVGMRGN